MSSGGNPLLNGMIAVLLDDDVELSCLDAAPHDRDLDAFRNLVRRLPVLRIKDAFGSRRLSSSRRCCHRGVDITSESGLGSKTSTTQLANLCNIF